MKTLKVGDRAIYRWRRGCFPELRLPCVVLSKTPSTVSIRIIEEDEQRTGRNMVVSIHSVYPI